MNVKLLRAEWRAVRRASLRLMHDSLSVVGLVSVGVAAVLVTHPEYAHAVGRWILPAAQPQSPFSALPLMPLLPSQPDPIVGAIVHPSGDAGRLLGLVVPGQAQDTDLQAAHSKAPPASQPETAALMSKVSTASGPTASREQREATGYLAKKYRVNADAIAMLVDAAYVTGKDLGIDPLLLLSVMGVESGFNPFAESTAGASGLMQLMSKVHRDKLNDFGGPNIALNPVVNLRVGAVVLKDCIRRGGSIADGLRLYVGAGTGDDAGYGARVLQETDRLAQAVHAPNRVRPAAAQASAPRPARDAAPDKVEAPAAEKVEAPVEEKLDARRSGVDDSDHGRAGPEHVAAL